MKRWINNYDPPLEGQNSDNEDQELEQKTQIIYANKIKNWSWSSIAAYFNIDKSEVLKIVDEFCQKLNHKKIRGLPKKQYTNS